MPPPLPPTIPSVPNAIQLGAQPPHNPIPMVGNDNANNHQNANQGDAAAAANAATAAALAATMAVTNERASSIPVDSFRSGVDDLDEWFEIFENAVKLAMNPSSDDRKWQLCKSWLPIKLDSEARAVYKQIPSTLTYEQTKTQLKDRLVDPNEVYKWKAMKTQIVWDGKESFQALATRVKRAVDNYEKELDDNGKKWAYFFRFRESLPETPYQDYIDLSLTKQDRTIENAMELASRVKMTQRDKEPAKEPKQVAFTGLAMADDRIGGLELAIAQLGTEVRNMSVQGKPSDDRGRSTSDGYNRYSRDRYRDSSGSPSRDRQYNRDRNGNRRDQSYGRDRDYRRDQESRREPSFSRDRDYRREAPRRDQDPNRDRNSRRDRDEQNRSGRDNRRDYDNGRQRNDRNSGRGRSPTPRTPSDDRNYGGRNYDRNRNQSRDRNRGDRNYNAIQTADEYSNDSEDDATLDARLLSLLQKKESRLARQGRNPEN